jgi:DNA segregation ATPase FtsK/SpoIIIE, S-DNA-T family
MRLRQGDSGDFGLAGVPARAVPAELGPGRGLLADDGSLVQLATEPGPDDAVRAAAAGIARRHPPAPETGRIRLRPLPESLCLADLPEGLDGLAVGLAGDECEPLVLDPFNGPVRLLVAGPPRSGRTTVLCSWARQAAAGGLPVVVAAPARSALGTVAVEHGLPVLRPDADPGPPPTRPTLLLVDDCDAFDDRPAGERLTDWLRDADAPLAAAVAGRADELATTYRGLGAAARRSHCGLLLRPGPVDGELLGIRLPRRPASGPPGRGVIVGDPAWGPLFAAGEPVPVQVAAP